MIGQFKTAHLLGICREHEPAWREVERLLTLDGYIVFIPAIYDLKTALVHKQTLDDMCYQKLLAADICVVVTPEHVGASTAKRIRQAMALKKPVYVWDWKHAKLGPQILTEIMLQHLIDQTEDKRWMPADMTPDADIIRALRCAENNIDKDFAECNKHPSKDCDGCPLLIPDEPNYAAWTEKVKVYISKAATRLEQLTRISVPCETPGQYQPEPEERST